MKKAEIRVGGLYMAKVNGRIVTVRVDKINEWSSHPYEGTNLSTGRKVAFRSAAKFREEVPGPSGQPFGQRVGTDGLLPSYKAHQERKAEEVPPAYDEVAEKPLYTFRCHECGRECQLFEDEVEAARCGGSPQGQECGGKLSPVLD